MKCLLVIAALGAVVGKAAPGDYGGEVLELLGNRTDKNAVGHGRNVALYTGPASKFFFATHSLGNVFSAVDGETIQWFPDHVRIRSPQSPGAEGITANWRVCVTREDVVVAHAGFTNHTDRAARARIVVNGDCRKSFDWREKPGGAKTTERRGDQVLLRDRNVFPAFLKDGLSMLVGANVPPAETVTEPPGTYRLAYEIGLAPGETRHLTLACAIDADSRRAAKHLRAVLRQPDPIAENRRDWSEWFARDIPRFRCSDRNLEELYAFRWFLLRFSTAGGDLGYFEYPVVMEGRQAYQTYCCYSAPFMAFDMNWARDPQVGFGHIANMAAAAYEDGRFPWYCSPRTNRVMVHHESRTGLSLLPHAAWKHYLIHGDKKLLRQIYPSMKKNMDWWIRDRDADGNGLFQIAHQYETGMDDLHRWGAASMAWRYDAVDATSYACINLRAIAGMAAVLGQRNDANYFGEYARRSTNALNSLLWHERSHSWRDRHPQTEELADVLAITTFYPFFAGAAGRQHLDVFRDHLLNADQFWLPHPVPALAKDQPDFKADGFWQGPSWPAATTHVLEGFATSAKQMDRSLLPQAAELFRRAAYNHLQPRADFYERYNPITGKPLSTFRDYMHSWWIDLFIQHVAGLTPDVSLQIDPLPMGLDYFSLEGAPWQGKQVDVFWNRRAQPATPHRKPGLTVYINGKKTLHLPGFEPGSSPARVVAR